MSPTKFPFLPSPTLATPTILIRAPTPEPENASNAPDHPLALRPGGGKGPDSHWTDELTKHPQPHSYAQPRSITPVTHHKQQQQELRKGSPKPYTGSKPYAVSRTESPAAVCSVRSSEIAQESKRREEQDGNMNFSFPYPAGRYMPPAAELRRRGGGGGK